MVPAPKKILVTGGAGFIGSSVAIRWKTAFPEVEVVAMDNLKRRGSELAIPRLTTSGVKFLHGDVRIEEDIGAAGEVDLLIECSAEPSVHAGYRQSPGYLVQTNLIGLINCLEHLRMTGGSLLFLSSSRVYPIAGLRNLPLGQNDQRFTPLMSALLQGWSHAGVSESFSTNGARSLYGATKLAAELLIEEYRAMYGLRAVINRCGVIAGPWQMGKVDQGFVVLWLARHVLGGRLAYSGFGGKGMQVRDILHVDDLYELLAIQADNMARLDGSMFNVGGGNANSVSLRELTEHCKTISGRHVNILSDPETRPADIPYYVSDCALVEAATGWKSSRTVETVLNDIHGWLIEEGKQLLPILQG